MSKSSRRSVLGSLGAASAALVLPHSHSAQVLSAQSGSPIRIGQIGVGHAHASKLSVYKASPEYEVVGVAEPDEALRKSAQSQPLYRDVKWMGVDELLNEKGLAAVLVETRVRDLLDVAEKCVAAGKHVHLDKPAGQSLPQFARILKMAQQKRLIVQMGYMFRYNPAVVLLRECLAKGWLGDVFEVHAVMSKVVEPASRKELAQFRGGIMFELGCHVLDLVIGVLGKPDEVTGYNQHVAKADDDLFDNMLAVLRYPKAIATVKASAQEVDGFARRQLTVCGTKGTFHIQPLDSPTAKVTFAEATGPYKAGYQELTFPKYVRYVDDAADMAKVIRREKEFAFTPEHDLTVQTTLLKACDMPLE